MAALHDQLPSTLQRAVTRVVAALFRVLLRHGFSYTAFEALARRVYVDVATREFGIPGKKPSVSRASILSGLTRKEVQRLMEEASAQDSDHAMPGTERHNRAGRVLAAWAREPDFIDGAGRPRRLPPEGPGSFAELVRRFSGDMPTRAVFDELQRLGAAQRGEDGHIEYLRPMFVGRRSATDKLELLGTDVADLITTIDHNVQHGETDPRFQRKVMYREMPASVVPEFRMLVAAHGMAVLQQLDIWLASHREAAAGSHASGPAGSPAAAPPPAAAKAPRKLAAAAAAAVPAAPPRVRLGLGIYYFEDNRPADPAARAVTGKSGEHS